MQNKSRKKLVLTGAVRFNSKPKLGLAFLEENKLIYSDLSSEVSREKSLAKFLKSSTRLDKRLLGDFLSKPDNLELLKEFMSLFDFKDVSYFFPRMSRDSHLHRQKPVVDAMREMLETLRLPGEGQQIDRIAETFASVYFASKPGTYRHLWYHTKADTCFAAHVQPRSKLKMLFMCWHSRLLCLTLTSTTLKFGQVQPCYPLL